MTHIVSHSTVLQRGPTKHQMAPVEYFNETKYGFINETYTITPQLWQDLGTPNTITITIEAGDTLNE